MVQPHRLYAQAPSARCDQFKETTDGAASEVEQMAASDHVQSFEKPLASHEAATDGQLFAGITSSRPSATAEPIPASPSILAKQDSQWLSASKLVAGRTGAMQIEGAKL